jgi:hypothetical protein
MTIHHNIQMTTQHNSTRSHVISTLRKSLILAATLGAIWSQPAAATGGLAIVAWAPGESLMPLGTFCRADQCGIPLRSTGLPYGEIIFVPIFVPSGEAATNIVFNSMSAPNGPLDVIRLALYRSDGAHGAPGTLISDLGETTVGAPGTPGTQAAPRFQTVSFPGITFDSTGIVYIALQAKSRNSTLTFIMSNPFFQASVGGNLAGNPGWGERFVSLTTANPFISVGDTQGYGQRPASTMLFTYAPFPARAVPDGRWNLVPWFGLGH